MPLPSPPVALDGVCSVIFNHTLYTYSAAAFQSLSLSPGAKWKKLPQGEKVTGGVCVGSTPGDPAVAGFYVVGGKGKTPGYQGLQKFTYSTGQWEAITPETAVTQDRLWHGAAYLNASDSILIYAGAQDGSQYASSQTFTVGASAPYAVSAYEASAPPAINPILIPWSASQAVMVGGSTTNTQVTLFAPETAWVDSGASLAEPLQKDITAMKAALVTGDDGSKNLYVFDMTVSPNVVKRTILVDGAGAPIQKAAPVARSLDAIEFNQMERRDTEPLNVGNWPPYNSALAPTATRSNYAMAEDQDGLVVFAGGNKDDILCMFNARENKWQNATSMLVKQSVFGADAISSSSLSATPTPTPTPTVLSSSSSTSISSTISATATPSSTQAAAAASGSKGLGTNTVLGLSLGSIFGLGVILIIIYLCLERRRKRQANLEAGTSGRGDAASSSEKDSIVFGGGGLPPGPVKGGFRGHKAQQDSQGSFSSMAILMGRMKHRESQSLGDVERNPSNGTKRSSTSSIFNKAFKSTISKPMPQSDEAVGPILPPPPPPGDNQAREDRAAGTRNLTPRAGNGASGSDRQGTTRRSSGWNRYWSGGSALNIFGFGHGNGNASSAGSGPGAGTTASSSKRMTVDSARSSNYSDRSQYRITQDSATVPPLNVYEPRASFSRVNTGSPTIAYFDNKLKDGMTGQIERPVSAVSDGSAYSSGIPASVHEAWDPTMPAKPWGSGSERAPSSAYSSGCATALTPAASALKPSSQVPTGVSSQPQLAMAATSSDMSWLNLGEHGNSRL